jgi:hypothetical protein|tara:strand:- start:812 stop:1477 length:666 start_codon:yes stop_codon:yes gene_type:complete
MSLYGRDANGNDAYIRGTGAGTTTDGHVTFHDSFSSEVKFKAVDLAASGDLVASVASTTLRVLSFSLSSDAPCTAQFQSEATDDISGKFYLNGGQSITQSNELGLFETDTGDKLNLVITEESLPVRLVDATTDALTVESHGLKFRDAVKVTASTTLPGGLVAGTTYFVVEDTDDTFKLATSKENASLNPPTVVDITDAGTGTISVSRAANVGVTLSYREVA